MITGFLFNNYKAFAEGSIDLKRLTILIGANSSGKSSITHLPLLFYQTANSGQPYKYQLPTRKRMFDMNGLIVKMGDLKSLIKNKNPDNILTFKFRLAINKSLQKSLSDIRDDFNAMLWETVRAYSVVFRERFEKTEGAPEQLKRVTDLSPPAIPQQDFRQLLLDALTVIRERLQEPDSQGPGADRTPPDTIEKTVLTRYSPAKGGLVLRKDIKKSEDYQLSSQFIDMLDNLHSAEFIIGFSLAYIETRNDFILTRLTFEEPCSPLMTFDFQTAQGTCVDVTIPFLQQAPLNKYKSFISKLFDLHSGNSLFDILRHYTFISNDPLFPELLTRFVDTLFKEFKDSFSASTFSYIGPLREYPQRYYIAAAEYPGSILSTYKIAELLANNPPLLKRTNDWLALFATEVGVDETADGVRRIKAIRNKLDYDLDISNVGFGISQILPVVVQALLSPPHSVTIVEQPEVHLHPNMQAKLADIFLNTIFDESNSERKLVVETHSEAFLNRLRLRIAQNKINKDDIAIYAFSVDEKNNGRIKQVSMLDGGDFNWPEDFIDEQLMDSIALAKLVVGAPHGHLDSV